MFESACSVLVVERSGTSMIHMATFGSVANCEDIRGGNGRVFVSYPKSTS